MMFNMEDPVVGGYNEKQNKLRKALSLAIDREEFIDIILNGRGQVAHSPVPPGITGYNSDYECPWSEFNLKKAKSLLSQAGYPNGVDPSTNKPLVLTYLYGVGASTTVPRWLVKKFEKLGIKLETEGNGILCSSSQTQERRVSNFYGRLACRLPRR